MNRDQLVAGGVAIAAFACSATHIYTVAKASGNIAPIAAVHPIGLDGLIYIGMRAVSNGRRWQGWLATIYGVAMSLTFNAVSYAGVGMPAAVMAVAMPLALVLGVLVVGHERVTVAEPVPVIPAKVSRARTAAVPAPVADVPAVTREAIAAVPDVTDDDRAVKVRAMLAEGRDKADVAATMGISVRTLNRWLSQGS